jgi:hypothetical protein
MRVIVAGMVAGNPGQGGATWAVLQYVQGLERLGHEVLLVEPIAAPTSAIRTYFEALALPRAALLVGGTEQTVGTSYESILDFGADLLINISGMLRDARLLDGIPARVFLDLDPVFAQIWAAQGHDPGLDRHTHFVTVGARLHAEALPGRGRRWLTTLPPVVLEAWPVADHLERDAFTTVGNWRSYGSATWQGVTYGQKAHAVRRLLQLPSLIDQSLQVALAIHPDEHADLEALKAHGWDLLDATGVAGTPAGYRRFVAGSKAEIGLVKAGYVDAQCGWLSDRSACYLASGRPVVAHDTGLAGVLPLGDGLMTFATAREAAAAITTVCADYEHHRQAARAIAETHLDSDRVLTRLLEQVL